MRRVLFVLVFLLLPQFVFAQPPVREWADVASYGTALVNPAIGVVSAWRSSEPQCRLSRLVVSELVGNGLTLTLKHFVASPRPCLNCAADGMPSGHTMNSVIGASGWRYGFAFAFGTGQLRRDAHRHTAPQVLIGAVIGIGSEVAGKLIHCP